MSERRYDFLERQREDAPSSSAAASFGNGNQLLSISTKTRRVKSALRTFPGLAITSGISVERLREILYSTLSISERQLSNVITHLSSSCFGNTWCATSAGCLCFRGLLTFLTVQLITSVGLSIDAQIDRHVWVRSLVSKTARRSHFRFRSLFSSISSGSAAGGESNQSRYTWECRGENLCFLHPWTLLGETPFDSTFIATGDKKTKDQKIQISTQRKMGATARARKRPTSQSAGTTFSSPAIKRGTVSRSENWTEPAFKGCHSLPPSLRFTFPAARPSFTSWRPSQMTTTGDLVERTRRHHVLV